MLSFLMHNTLNQLGYIYHLLETLPGFVCFLFLLPI